MKYVLGMSGGVDSSTSAAILKNKGHEVIGCTLKIFDSPKMEASIADAQKVAAFLGIKHEVVDCVADFKKYVIDYFTNSYKNGQTPNPCVMCNENVKFKFLEQFRRKHEADFLATGHYVNLNREGERLMLKPAKDPRRDQSYFLYAVDREILLHAEFVLGNFEKSETRALAKQLGIPVAEKKDSQDICFIPNNDYVAYLRENLRNPCDFCCKKGHIVTEDGKILGDHDGIIEYTVGQRKGLGLCGGPFFVKELDAARNAVVVTDHDGIKVNSIDLSDVKFLNGEFIGDCLVKYRSSGRKIKAEILKNANSYVVKLAAPEFGVAKGQHCVFYLDDCVVGGGVIRKAA